MVSMNSHSATLAAAIADLRSRRDQIDAAIAGIEAVLNSEYEGGTDSKPKQQRTRPPSVIHYGSLSTGEPVNRSDRVRKLFADNPHKTWDAEGLVVGAGDTVNENTLKAIHAILSRMRKAGSIERVARGRYRAAKNASAPDATGAEDQEESMSDFS